MSVSAETPGRWATASRTRRGRSPKERAETSDSASSIRIACPEGSQDSVVVSETGRDSRRFARPSEPATDTAVSKDS